MSDDGTSFTIDLPVTGQPAIDAAARSADTLQAKLEAVSKVVKAGEVAFRQQEATANRAAKAVESIGVRIEAQKAKVAAAAEAGNIKGYRSAVDMLKKLNDRQTEATTKALQAKAAVEQEAKAFDKLKEGSKKLEDFASKAKAASKETGFEGIRRGLNRLGGPLAEIGGKVLEVASGFQKLGKNLGSTTGLLIGGTAVALAMAAAIVAVAVAAGSAAIKIASWAVSLADANRSNELLAQGMLRFSRTGGAELNSKINWLTSRLPLTREEVAETAQQLANAGLRGQQLANALQTMTVRAANLKFGPNWEKEMLSLNQQSKILDYNLSRVFGGLKVEGALGALQNLGDLLDTETASGRAIKAVFESLFQPLLDGLVAAEPKIEAFFLQLEIWTLKALIWLKPHGSEVLKIAEAFGVVALIIGGLLLTALAAVAAAIAVPIVLLAGFVLAIQTVASTFGDVFKALPDQFVQFGKDMIAGLISGIVPGGSAVVDALKGVVTGAVDAAKKALGIASPSKVFAEIGMQTGAGMAVGVEGSTAGVQNAFETMTAPPTVGSAAGSAPAPAASSSGSSKSIDLSGASFTFNGVENAEQANTLFADTLTRIMEGDAAQLGAVAPG